MSSFLKITRIFSFVNQPQDVTDLLHELKKRDAEIGIILKIETQKAFENLPSILLKSMENYPVGVMIARGDLAIETGWKNVAIIQEEIMQLFDAAHIPHVLATQVLENLAKKESLREQKLRMRVWLKEQNA